MKHFMTSHARVLAGAGLVALCSGLFSGCGRPSSADAPKTDPAAPAARDLETGQAWERDDLEPAAGARAAGASSDGQRPGADVRLTAEPQRPEGRIALHGGNPLRGDAPPDAVALADSAGSRLDAPAVPVAPEGPVAENAAEPGTEPGAESTPAARSEGDGWGKGKHSGVAFDPYKENGHFFTDWPKPKLAIVLTGLRNGYMEPCGCAGKDRMKGGVSRLHTLLRRLREKQGWETVALDLGGLSKGFGLQGVIKFHALVDAMRKMGYDAVNLGTSDVKTEIGDLISVTSGVGGEPGLFISSNVGLLGFEAGFTGKPRVVEAAGLKVGVIGVLGKEYQKQIHSDDLAFADPADVIGRQLAELKGKCDLLVLLSHATLQESTELARKFPVFHFVVSAGGGAEPPAAPNTVEGTRSWLIEVGEKGMNAIVIGLFDDPKRPFRYQRVILDSRYDDSEDMKQIMVAYQEQLKDLGLEGLGLNPVPHPRREENGGFVGTQECRSCHDPSYQVWKKSGHAKAWKTLVEGDPPRNFDPECISCHVVGWNPQKYFPYQTGFLSQKETPHLIDVGCETCHGPGKNHVDAELGRLAGGEETKKKYRQAVVVTKEESEKRMCLECHDLDNSPDFDFKTYWPRVEHYEDE